MLPLFASDLHHRHERSSCPELRWTSPSPKFKGKRPMFRRLFKGILVACISLPACLFLIEAPRWQTPKPRNNAHPVMTVGDQQAITRSIGSTDSMSDEVVQPNIRTNINNNQQKQEVQTDTQSQQLGGRRMMAGLPPLPGSHLKHLIVVAGHAVYVGRDYSEALNESSWFLEDYQKIPGEAASFVEHIQLGIKEAERDPEAMLLFSGGQTRLAAGPRSEGLSYWVVAEAAGWFNSKGVRERTFTEEHARDSFENLLFSLCRFYELAGHYPDMVTMVSYTLKENRFMNIHRPALRFPAARFRFIGNEVPPAAVGAQAGEARTASAFQQDPYGCHEGGELLLKKLRRDPFAVGPPHPSRCPALKGLLLHCEVNIYKGPLPWAA